jgi:hypothetical protein
VFKRVLVADHDILVTSSAHGFFGKVKTVRPIYTNDFHEALRQLHDNVLEREDVGSPRLYGAVIESLWPDAENPLPDEMEQAGIRRDAIQEYRNILQRGRDLYTSSPPLGLLIALRAARLMAPVVLTISPTSTLNARDQIAPIQEYAEARGWKFYAPDKTDKKKFDFWKKCLTRFDNKWLERVLEPQGDATA